MSASTPPILGKDLVLRPRLRNLEPDTTLRNPRVKRRLVLDDTEGRPPTPKRPRRSPRLRARPRDTTIDPSYRLHTIPRYECPDDYSWWDEDKAKFLGSHCIVCGKTMRHIVK